MVVDGMKQSKRVLSLDQASLNTGYCVFEDGKPIKWGLIQASDKDDIWVRSHFMADEVGKLIKKFAPTLVICEGVQDQKNTQNVIKLAALLGRMMQVCDTAKTPFMVLGPTEWRSYLGYQQGAHIKRAELKKQSIQLAKEKFGLDEYEDVCEAICIGLAYYTKFDCEGK